METIQFANAEFLPRVCEFVNKGHSVTIKAKGVSMRPFIETERDDVVLVKQDKFRVGDIALAEISKGVFVLHRIDAIDGDVVTMRGDGNVGSTETCRMEDLRAGVSHIVRLGKTYSIESRTWQIYSWWWVRLLPVRRILLGLYRLLWMHQLPARWTKRR